MEVALHAKQLEVFAHKARFKVVVAGRRWGKTALAKETIKVRAARKKKQRIWYIAPTYRMAKGILWEDLLESIPKSWVKKVNHSSLSIKLINNSLIELKGSDRPDDLRGVGLHYVILDEFQEMHPDVWIKVIRPTLSSTGGEALIIGTPKQFRGLYPLWKLGQVHKQRGYGQWYSWQFPTALSPFIPRAEIEQARRDMDPKSFEAEYMAQFVNVAGRVYYPFDRKIHVGSYPFNPKLPIWVGQDFNIDPMSSVIMQPQPNGKIWIVDELNLPNSNTFEVASELDRRYWKYQDNVTIYPDPAGAYRQHARGESDLDIFKEKGFKKIRHRKKHPPVADRINIVCSRLMSADGTVSLLMDKSCEKTIESFEQTMYKPESRDIDKKMNIEHLTDAVGYPMEIHYPLKKFTPMGVSLN